MKVLVLIVSTLVYLFPSLSYCKWEEIDVTQELRIHQLIPADQYAYIPAIEPAIPPNFIALDKKGGTDYGGSVVGWGPENVLKAYFKDPNSLSEPILQVFIYYIDEHDGFNKEKWKKEMAESGYKKSSVNLGKWGYQHPYVSLSFLDEEMKYMALIGVPDSHGLTYFVSLVYPQKNGEKKPDAKSLKFWEKFLKETKELPDPLFFKAHDQELHPGYTIVSIFGRKAKVIAEKRKSDQMVQFIVLPLTPNLSFDFENAFVTRMEADWHAGKPLLKIKGNYTVSDSHHIEKHMTTSVLLKEISEFTEAPILKKNAFVKQFKN